MSMTRVEHTQSPRDLRLSSAWWQQIGLKVCALDDEQMRELDFEVECRDL